MSGSVQPDIRYTDLKQAEVGFLEATVPGDAAQNGLTATINPVQQGNGLYTVTIHFDPAGVTAPTGAAVVAGGQGVASQIQHETPNTHFGTLVSGGFFSSDPSDHSVPRPIRANNPGALNMSSWQRTRPGFVDVTEPDGSSNHNVTTVYRTPEHGVGSWFHLLVDIYGFHVAGNFMIQQLAQHYAGTATGPSVTDYINGWLHFGGGALTAATVINLYDDAQMLILAKAMFSHEAGTVTPLHDDQIAYGIARERAGNLPA
jgi:hypothetical protein